MTGFAEKTFLKSKSNTTASLALMKKDGKYIAKLPQEAQYSNIRDFYWDEDKKQLFYVGNAQEFVTEIGNTAANPGGVISVEQNETFHLKHQTLPLPCSL